MTPKQMGRKGGKATFAKMTPAQKTALGKKAARARWGKKAKRK